MCKILIVDDHPLVREGLAARISSQADLSVCGETDNLDDALRLVKETSPDLVLVDISLRGGNGLDLIKQVSSRGERPRMLVSSMYDDKLYAERAIRAGALGYINKQEMAEKILQAIRQVMAGQIFLSPQMAQRLLRRSVQGDNQAVTAPAARLSDRELEVFGLIGQGKTTRQIANDLHLSVKTVETHRENIKTKLGAGNAAELARQAVQWVLENG